MSKNKKLPKLTDKQTKELVEGARMAHGGGGLNRFLDQILNPDPKDRSPKVGREVLERHLAKILSEKNLPSES
jgi:hypothetical protein